MHAATGSSRVWEYQIPAFTAAGFRVIAFDRRGFGADDNRAGRRPAGHGGRRSASADGPPAHRPLSSRRHGRRRIRRRLTTRCRFRSGCAAWCSRTASAGCRTSTTWRSDVGSGRPSSTRLPADVRELGPVVSRRRTRTAPAAGSSSSGSNRAPGTPPPAQTMRNQVTFARLETIKTPTLLLTGGADLYAPPPVMQLFVKRIKGCGVSGRARSGALDVLGAARGVQQRGAGVHPQALDHEERRKGTASGRPATGRLTNRPQATDQLRGTSSTTRTCGCSSRPGPRAA